MKCRVCGQDNPAGASFCSNCGDSLVTSEGTLILTCRVCGHGNPPEAGFCGSCGAVLEGSRLASTATPIALVGPLAGTAGHAGFWIRFGAAAIDAVPFVILSALYLVPGLLYYWLFTGLKGQTPGKMAVRIKVVDAEGNRPGLGAAALREIPGKFISMIALFVGFFWIAFDSDRQGWHDKIAKTYVVRLESRRQGERDDAVP